MLWLVLSLLTASAVAVRDVTVKKISSDLNLWEILTLEMSWSLPLLGLGFLFVPVPTLDRTFWWTLIASLPINGLAYILYLKAITCSPLSLTVPFLAFTPVFMIVTGALILGESITLWGGLGLGLIVGGSYVLNLPRAKGGILKPFTALASEKGSWLMLLTAAIFSVAAVLGKKGILLSSPLFFTYLFFLLFNITVLIGLALTKGNHFRSLRSQWPRGAWLGSLLFIHVSCHGLAIAVSTAVYMIAVKRSSILFTVLLSWLVLKEKNIATRGLGTLLMFGGVLLISILG